MKKVILLVFGILFVLAVNEKTGRAQNAEVVKQEVLTEEQKQKLETYLKEMESICKSFNSLTEAETEVGKKGIPVSIFQIGKQSVSILIDKLSDKTKDWKYRCLLLQELAFIFYNTPDSKDDRVIELALEGLKNEVGEVRKHAAFILGKVHNNNTIVPLINLLIDDYWQARVAAISALGELREKQAVEPLLNLLDDPNKHVRIAVVKALVKIGEPKAIDPLLSKIIKEEDSVVRAEYLLSLSDLQGDDIFNKLVELLEKDKSPDVRARSARGLAKYENKKLIVIENLTKALFNDKHPLVRSESAMWLGRIGEEGTIEILRKRLLEEKEEMVKNDIEFSINNLKKKFNK